MGQIQLVSSVCNYQASEINACINPSTAYQELCILRPPELLFLSANRENTYYAGLLPGSAAIQLFSAAPKRCSVKGSLPRKVLSGYPQILPPCRGLLLFCLVFQPRFTFHHSLSITGAKKRQLRPSQSLCMGRVYFLQHPLKVCRESE